MTRALPQGSDGSRVTGFPASHTKLAHGSPFLYDVDGDGRPDVGQVLYDGSIVFVAPTGESLEQHTLRIPPLVVQTNWHVGLAADPVDHSHPDVNDSETNTSTAWNATVMQRRRRLMQADAGGDDGALREAAFQAFRKSAETWDDGAGVDPSADPLDAGDAATLARNDLQARHKHLGMPASTDATTADYASASHSADGDYNDGFGDRPVSPGMEEPAGPGTLAVDAHVLCSPTLGDLDGDGVVESLIVSVSYFFDKDTYADTAARARLPADIVLSNYMATGLVVFDLRHTREQAAGNHTAAHHHVALKWKLHLDLSTDAASYKAMAYSTPVVADVDGDGQADIMVGTSAGYVYCVSGQDGTLRRGYPLQLGDVQAPPGVADTDGDGKLELIVSDMHGSVACFKAATGVELWERHLASSASQGATFADVDGDGVLDVILGTADGRVHVLQGTTGKDVEHFPYATGGRVMAPVTPVPVQPSRTSGVQLLVASFDGRLHIVDGRTGCSDTFDVSETMYAAPLTADLDGDGRTDIVVATMNGNVLCLSTPWKHHPAMTWRAQAPDGNSVVRGAAGFGVHISAGTRATREVSGTHLRVQFTIQDTRPGASKTAAGFIDARMAAMRAAGTVGVPLQRENIPGPYRVVLRVKVADASTAEGVTTASYSTPGTYALSVPMPPVQGRAAVSVTVWDFHALAATDHWSVALHSRHIRLLKWFLAGPYAAMVVAILWSQAILPSEHGALRWGKGHAAQD